MACHSERVRFAQGKLREESAFGCGFTALYYSSRNSLWRAKILALEF
jgi:hypothetical protein